MPTADAVYYYILITIILSPIVIFGFEIWSITAVLRFARRVARRVREELARAGTEEKGT